MESQKETPNKIVSYEDMRWCWYVVCNIVNEIEKDSMSAFRTYQT